MSNFDSKFDHKEILTFLVPGGRDRKGYLFITILKDATTDDVKLDDLRKVILYLTTHRR